MNVIQTGYIKISVSSTGSYLGINSQVFSTLESTAPIFANKISVNSFILHSDTYYQDGSLYITGSTVVQSSIYMPGTVLVDGDKTILGSVKVQTDAAIYGSLLFSTNTGGKFTIKNELSTNYRFYAENTVSTGGQVSISSFARVQNNMYVSTLRTISEYGSQLQTNEFVFSGNAYIRNRPDIAVVSPTYTDVTTPVVEIQQGIIEISQNNPTVHVSDIKTVYNNTAVINITSSFNGPKVTQMYLNNATIYNENGSLAISTLYTSNMSLSNTTIYGPNQSQTIPIIATGNVNVSTGFFNNTANFAQTMTVDNVIADTCSTNATLTSSLVYGNSALAVSGLSLSTFFVSSAFIANEMSSFSVPYSIFNNRQGRLYTSNSVMSTTMTSSLYGLSYMAGNSSINLIVPSVETQNISVSTANVVVSTSASTLYTNNITFGIPYEYSTFFTNAPYMTTSTVSGFTSNTSYEFITGIGIPYNPLRIKAAVDRTVNIYLQNTSSFAVRYLTMQYTYINSGSSAGAGGIRMVNNGITSTILSFSASPIQAIQTASLSNFPVNANPITSTYQYYLIGPTTYAPASTTIARNIVLAGGIGTTTTISYSSDGGLSWVPLKFTPLTSSCIGLARGSDRWIGAGEGSATSLAYSYNGSLWYSLGKNIFTIRGRSVAWNGSIWVGAGEGTNTLAYSKDGVNWTGVGSTIFTAGYSVAWNGTQWLATGLGSNTLAYSGDGSNWNGIGSTIFTAGTAVAWGSNKWIATGAGSNTLAYSLNGSSWTGLGSNIFRTANAVAWNGSQWLAGGGPQIATSVDGISWSTANVSTILSSVRGISYASSNWVVTGTALTNALAYSTDGLNWAGRTVSTIFATGLSVAAREQLPRGVPVSAPSFVPVIACGNTNVMSLTTDGITWTTLTNPFTSNIYCIAWNGSIWVAGGTGTYQLAYSTNGTSWVGVTLPNMTAVYSVAWGLNGWIACGTGAAGYTSASSTNGISWTEINYSTGNFFSTSAYGIAWAENVWVAVGATLGSGILLSINGTSWNAQSTTLFTTGRAVANNGEFWIAGGDYLAATLAYSYDGALWYGLGNSIFTTTCSGVAAGQNMWVAVGSGTNSIAFSYDGISWIGLGTSIFTAGTSVAYNGSVWFATGSGANTLAYSMDGVNWFARGSAIGGVALASRSILPNTVTNINEPSLIRWDLSGTLLMSPSAIEKPLNSAIAWDSRASSLDGYTSNALFTFTPRQTKAAVIIGLSEAPRTTNSYTSINYGFYLTTTSTVFIYELGAQMASLGSFRITDIFSIKFTGSLIIYYVNSVAVRTIARAVGNPLYVSSSFRNPGCRIDGIQFQPLFQMVETQPVPDSVSYLTSIRPARDDLQYVNYSMPASSGGLNIGNWQFNIPISGNLSSTSSVLYADFLINSTKLFSTNYIISGFQPQPSTCGIRFNISSFIPTTNTDVINLNIRTQRGTGESYFYTNFSTGNSTLSTVIRNDAYNLSSITYLQFYHTSFNSGIQTSEVSMSLNALSTNSQSYIDSNYTVSMNKSYMVWPNRLYGISINNRFNDLQTRNVTYSGSLYNASDSNLKSDIDYANINDLYESIHKLPLRHYGFNPQYLSTFQPLDRHQVGVLTTEVEALFPKMINTVEPEYLGLSTLQTVDRGQLKFAHLGATQRLIQKVSTISGELKHLR
uniref:Peptidase S74 domain-containing protein n=1 Tax=viral metagenome TaxID=1070528 RepID=A0A6C0JY89_9ZZZZ